MIFFLILTILSRKGPLFFFLFPNGIAGRYTEKNGFVTAAKLGTIFFVAATKDFDAATERFVDKTKHYVFFTKYFCCPYFNK